MIKLYIITYNNQKSLNNTLLSLFSSEINNLQVNIINNHSNFTKPNFPVNIIHNSVRPDFSTGHLARDWNCAILNGFKSLTNPDCDILITCQNDTVFNPNWLKRLLELHKTYNFVSAAPGDGFCSYTPNCVKEVGLWDERFNSIEFQEADYFNRQKLFNSYFASINDFHHNRLLNTFLNSEDDQSFVYRSDFTDREIHNTSHQNHDYNLALLKHKYGARALDFHVFSTYQNKQTILYPYFEKDIIDLRQKYETFGYA